LPTIRCSSTPQLALHPAGFNLNSYTPVADAT
jgi:hypothetical protein